MNTPSATQIPNCTNDLEVLADLSIPDGTQLNPLKGFDKEWKVRNSGTCNWTDAYSVKLVSGPELGVEPTQPLVYTLNGAEAVISISFTAPIEPGRYSSTWRAVAPDGHAVRRVVPEVGGQQFPVGLAPRLQSVGQRQAVAMEPLRVAQGLLRQCG